MRYIFATLFFCYIFNLQANTLADTLIDSSEKKQKVFSIEPSVTITNKHLWRSFASGTAPCIEPNVTWRYKNFSLDTWASYSVDNSYREIDFIVTYSWNNLSVTLSDYYCPIVGKKEKFTNLNNAETDHLFELKTDFTISQKFPLNLLASVLFAGSDIEKTDTGVKQLYSTYFELSYPFHIVNTVVKAEVGMTPFKSMYADRAKVFNYGISVANAIKINNKFSLPMKYKLAYNSDQDVLNFSVMLTFS